MHKTDAQIELKIVGVNIEELQIKFKFTLRQLLQPTPPLKSIEYFHCRLTDMPHWFMRSVQGTVSPSSGLAGFLMEEVALGQVPYLSHMFSLISIIPPSSLSTHSSVIYAI